MPADHGGVQSEFQAVYVTHSLARDRRADSDARACITPGIASSVADIAAPKKSKYVLFSEHYDGGSAVSQLDLATGQIERLWKGDETIFTMDGGGVSVSDDGKWSAVVRNSWQRPPDVWFGRIGDWD